MSSTATTASFEKTDKQREAVKLLGRYHTTLLEGGGRCFIGKQLIVTPNGPKQIRLIREGDIVHTINEKTGIVEPKPVEAVYKNEHNSKPMVHLKLKNGETITGTEDHEIFFEGGWHTLKYVLQCVHGRMDKHSGVQ